MHRFFVCYWHDMFPCLINDNDNKSNNRWHSTISSWYSIIGKELVPKGNKSFSSILSRHYSDRKLATEFELLKKESRLSLTCIVIFMT